MESLPVLEEFASEAQIEAASKVSRPPKLHVPRVYVPPSDHDKQEIEAEKRRLEADQRARAKLKREAKKAAQDQSEANLGNMLASMACLEGGIVAIRFLAKLVSADVKDGDQIDAEEVLHLNPATCLRLQNIAATFGFTYSDGYFWCDMNNGVSAVPGARARIALILNIILSDYATLGETNGESEELASESEQSTSPSPGQDEEPRRKSAKTAKNNSATGRSRVSTEENKSEGEGVNQAKNRRRTRAGAAALHDSLRVFVQAVSRVQKVSENGEVPESSP